MILINFAAQGGIALFVVGVCADCADVVAGYNVFCDASLENGTVVPWPSLCP